jgi:hypothetical protein
MNPFDRRAWYKATRKAMHGDGGPAWVILGIIIITALLIIIFR